MSPVSGVPSTPWLDDRVDVARDVAQSLAAPSPAVMELADYLAALDHDRDRTFTHASIKPLAELTEWDASPERTRITHRTGRFFSVEGLRVTMPSNPVQSWDQPIVVQSEVGVLGIIAKKFNGTMHFLMQNKVEPGNRNGIQLSPTVQATRSNFTRVHGGAAIPYLGYFLSPGDRSRQRVLADVRHTEQGSWFFRKRNRNMVIEVFDDVDVQPGWYWLTLSQIAELLTHDDLVNMEVRSVLACLPLAVPRPAQDDVMGLALGDSLRQSCDPGLGAAHSTLEILSWVTRARSDHEQGTELCSLHDVGDWEFGPDRLAHRSGRYFTVIGVDVTARGREVRRWDQPMVSAGAGGVVAFLVTTISGALHVLVQLRAEAGGFDGPELAPTVQCDPTNYLPGEAPPLLDEVLGADAERVLFDTMLSDEGGRFFHTSHRHLIVQAKDDSEPEGFRWLTLAQCADLAQHSHYLNVQTRSLLACVLALFRGATT
ncbi:NDP-hexose 2,3-dehydratase family protein [Nocardioides lijunqiniae]|uniref:NDP-hexose 2,3-dehydratase family protein n=1 Tax=Nocardioides lijunqiniae TaxID=2760832 RepID=UPI0018783277